MSNLLKIFKISNASFLNKRLDIVLFNLLKKYSRSYIQKCILNGFVKINYVTEFKKKKK